jgi:transposase
MEAKRKKKSFKVYRAQSELYLSHNLGHYVPEHHIGRVINEAIDSIDLSGLEWSYKGGGCSSYSPRLLLKGILYGYVNKVYSSRGIEKMMRENLIMMWLCSMEVIDHNTINNFRKGVLKDHIDGIFASVLGLLVERGCIKLEKMHTDGTKIEASANRYTFVWGKSVGTQKGKLVEKIRGLLREMASEQAVQEQEEATLLSEQPTICASDLSTCIIKINEELKIKQALIAQGEEGEETKLEAKLEMKLAKKKIEAWRKYQRKLAEYEQKERLLAGRNSYSKTDTDATFMRMKEDHMKNGQLKPGYNLQISTEAQFIISYSVHQNAADSPTFKPHMEHTEAQLASIGQPLPPIQVADAAYGSEENYLYLEEKGVAAYIKYGTQRKEQTKKWKLDPSKVSNLHYNEQGDFFVCPMGQRMTFRYTTKTTTSTGFEAQSKVYQAQNCEHCPMRGVCFAAQGQRKISVNPQLNRLKQKARALLETQQGKEIYAQRSIDVEPTFGNIKWNADFKRFYLRSLPKVKTEVALLALAQNFKKWAKTLLFYPFLSRFFKNSRFFIIYKIFMNTINQYLYKKMPQSKSFETASYLLKYLFLSLKNKIQ